MRVFRKRDPLNHEYTLHGKVLEAGWVCKASRSNNKIASTMESTYLEH